MIWRRILNVAPSPIQFQCTAFAYRPLMLDALGVHLFYMLRNTSRPLKSCYSSQMHMMHISKFSKGVISKDICIDWSTRIHWKAPTMSADDVVKTLRQLTLDRVADVQDVQFWRLQVGIKPAKCWKSALVTACLQCAQRPLEVIFHSRLLIGPISPILHTIQLPQSNLIFEHAVGVTHNGHP